MKLELKCLADLSGRAFGSVVKKKKKGYIKILNILFILNFMMHVLNDASGNGALMNVKQQRPYRSELHAVCQASISFLLLWLLIVAFG